MNYFPQKVFAGDCCSYVECDPDMCDNPASCTIICDGATSSCLPSDKDGFCKTSSNLQCTVWRDNGPCVNYCMNQVCDKVTGVDHHCVDGVCDDDSRTDTRIISCGGGTCLEADEQPDVTVCGEPPKAPQLTNPANGEAIIMHEGETTTNFSWRMPTYLGCIGTCTEKVALPNFGYACKDGEGEYKYDSNAFKFCLGSSPAKDKICDYYTETFNTSLTAITASRNYAPPDSGVYYWTVYARNRQGKYTPYDRLDIHKVEFSYGPRIYPSPTIQPPDDPPLPSSSPVPSGGPEPSGGLPPTGGPSPTGGLLPTVPAMPTISVHRPPFDDPGIEADEEGRIQICDDRFGGSRTVFLKATAVKADDEISKIGISMRNNLGVETAQIMVSGINTANPSSSVISGSNIATSNLIDKVYNGDNVTVRVPITFGYAFPSDLYRIYLYTEDTGGKRSQEGMADNWVDSGLRFKVWDCDVRIQGSLFDSSSVPSVNCISGVGFTDLAPPGVDFSALTFFGVGVPNAQMQVNSPNYNSFVGRGIQWGRSYMVGTNLLGGRNSFNVGFSGTDPTLRMADLNSLVINSVDVVDDAIVVGYSNTRAQMGDFISVSIPGISASYRAIGSGGNPSGSLSFNDLSYSGTYDVKYHSQGIVVQKKEIEYRRRIFDQEATVNNGILRIPFRNPNAATNDRIRIEWTTATGDHSNVKYINDKSASDTDNRPTQQWIDDYSSVDLTVSFSVIASGDYRIIYLDAAGALVEETIYSYDRELMDQPYTGSGVISVSVSNELSEANDNVRLYRPDGSYIRKYLNNLTTAPSSPVTTPVTLTFSVSVAGTYELRYYSAGGSPLEEQSVQYSAGIISSMRLDSINDASARITINFANPSATIYDRIRLTSNYAATEYWFWLNGSNSSRPTTPVSGEASVSFVVTRSATYTAHYERWNSSSLVADLDNSNTLIYSNDLIQQVTTDIGSSINVQYSNPAWTRTDKIRLYRDGELIATKYLNNRTTAPSGGSYPEGWVNFYATRSATYEVRYYNSSGQTMDRQKVYFDMDLIKEPDVRGGVLRVNVHNPNAYRRDIVVFYRGTTEQSRVYLNGSSTTLPGSAITTSVGLSFPLVISGDYKLSYFKVDSEGIKTRLDDQAVAYASGIYCPVDSVDTYTFDDSIVSPYGQIPTLDIDLASNLTETGGVTPPLQVVPAWYQVSGGGILARDEVVDNIPTNCALDPTNNCQPFSTISGLNMDNSLVASNVITVNNGERGNPNNWSVNRNIFNDRVNYEQLMEQYYGREGLGQVLDSGSSLSQVAAANRNGVIFVNGDLTVDTNTILPASGFLMMVVRGGVDIRPNVSNFGGIILADGSINIGGSSPDQLQVNGMLYSGGGSIYISRVLDDVLTSSTTPSVLINYSPGLIFNMPSQLTRALSQWREGL